jgi:O-antigen/teichoic acid export membrane protein
MKRSAQLVLGVANNLTSAVSLLAMAPVYLRYLGAESYGLVGFYTTLLICVQAFDMGMSATLNRTIAQRGSATINTDSAQLLLCIEYVYTLISFGLILIGLVFGAWFVSFWFDAKSLSDTEIAYAFYAICTCVALRLPTNIYQSALMGAQKMHIVSILGITQLVASSLVSYALLRFAGADLVVFFVWQIVVALVHLVTIRTLVWRLAPRLPTRSFDWTPFRHTWRYSISVGLISIAGLVLSQVDKIILSRVVSLDQFANYMLATTVASCVYMISGPLYNLFFPFAASLVSKEHSEQLKNSYQFYTVMLVSLIFPLALYLVLFLPQLVDLWLGISSASDSISFIAKLLVIAAALHAVMYMPHALMMACGLAKTYTVMYVALIAISVPATICFATLYGAIGGAIAQVFLFVCYCVAGTLIAHRYCLKEYAFRWLFRDVGLPLGVVVMAWVAACTTDLHKMNIAEPVNLGFSLLLLFIVCGLCMLTGTNNRRALLSALL